jgi:hypothetical protein
VVNIASVGLQISSHSIFMWQFNIMANKKNRCLCGVGGGGDNNMAIIGSHYPR